MKAAVAWSTERVRELRRSYGSNDSEELAKQLDVSVRELEKKARELALAKNKHRFKGNTMPRWTADELETLGREYATTPSIELARKLNRSLKSVNSRARMLGLRKDVEYLSRVAREAHGARAPSAPAE